MGTRNLTMVIDQKGVTKVAQYGQWDGYPSGVGIDILKILRDKELFDKLKANLSKVRFLSKRKADINFLESYNTNVDLNARTEEQIKWFSSYITRDLAEEVLINIANSDDKEILLIRNENTGKRGGCVEYSYVINLKENTFGIYGHIDQPPMKVYSLDELPEEEIFLKDLTNNDDEE